jgi:hypothetical protein
MNPTQTQIAICRQRQVARLLELRKQSPRLSLWKLGKAVGASGPTACRLLQKFQSADLPLEYYSDGYKEPLPLPTRLQLAEKSYVQALENLAEIKQNLKSLGDAYRSAKSRAEDARRIFLDLYQQNHPK